MKYNRTKISLVLVALVAVFLLIKYFLLDQVLHLGEPLLTIISIVYFIIALYIAQAVSKEGPKEDSKEKK